MGDVPTRFAAAMEALDPPHALGLAVSGGGDSMAMLHLAQAWAKPRGIRLAVATIDHALRPESGKEAASVGTWCHALGLPHQTLRWQGDKPDSNLQAEARQARRQLLIGWAVDQDLGAVMMAHTADDQAETVLMRLQRGSGVDGLAGMSAASALGPVRLLRPMLGFERDELREWLRANGTAWIEDPTNQDQRFDRIATRKAMAELKIAPKRVALAASHMSAARQVLDQAAFDLARQAVREEWATLVLDPALMAAALQDTRERVWAAAIRWLSGSIYKPRLHALRGMMAASREGHIAQLDGVVALPDSSGVRLARDPACLARTALDHRGHWAGIALLSPDDPADALSVQPAGPEGLAAISEWRGNLPRRAALAEPMVYQQGQPLGFVHASLPDGVEWRRLKAAKSFAHSLLSQDAH